MHVRIWLQSLGQEDLLGSSWLAMGGFNKQKWILKKYDGRLLVVLSWMKIGNSCGLV